MTLCTGGSLPHLLYDTTGAIMHMRGFIIVALVEIALIVPITSIGANIGGELVTGFYLNTTEVDGDTYLVVENTGPLQATGVVLSGSVDGVTQPSHWHDCPEGNVKVHGDRILATFDRMTPNHRCTLASVPTDADLSSVTITADGYTTVWTKAGAEFMDALWAFMWTWPGALIVAFVVWNALLLAYILTGLKDLAVKLPHLYRRLKWRLRESDRKEMPLAKHVASYLHREYGIVDDKDIAAVVVVIMCGKETPGQIKRHTGMARGRIMYILRLLKDEKILSSDGSTLVDSLRCELLDHVDDLCGSLERERLNIGADEGGVHHVGATGTAPAADLDTGESSVEKSSAP